MIEREKQDGSVDVQVVEAENEEQIKRQIDVIFDEALAAKDVTRITVFKNCYRNRPCPCGSQKKFKKCCMERVNTGWFNKEKKDHRAKSANTE